MGYNVLSLDAGVCSEQQRASCTLRLGRCSGCSCKYAAVIEVSSCRPSATDAMITAEFYSFVKAEPFSKYNALFQDDGGGTACCCCCCTLPLLCRCGACVFCFSPDLTPKSATCVLPPMCSSAWCDRGELRGGLLPELPPLGPCHLDGGRTPLPHVKARC